MNAGDLDNSLVFEKAEEPFDQGDSGAFRPVYVPAYECYGSVRPLSGSERFAAQQIQAKADVVITIRDPGSYFVISPAEALRIVDLSDRGRVYDITRVERAANQNRRSTLEITAWARAEAEAVA